MKTYARIANNAVAELLTTASDPSLLFYPSLQWIDVTAQPGIQVGYVQDPSGFRTPPPPAPVVIQMPTLTQLQAELASLSAQIAALTPHS
jgi:hypothetical protein